MALRERLPQEGIIVDHGRADQMEEAATFCATQFGAYPYIPDAAEHGGPDIVEVATQGGKVVGISTFFGWTLAHEMPEYGPILLDPSLRKRKIGKLLLFRSTEELKRRGYKAVRLSCYSDKYRFYSSAGFEFRERFYQAMSKELEQ